MDPEYRKTLLDEMKELRPIFYSLAMRYTRGNYNDAEDLVQDTFITAYSKLDTLRKRSALYTWMYIILTNIYLDRINSRDIINIDNVPEIPFEDEFDIDRRYRSSLVADAIRSLPDGQRDVILLELNGLTYHEIAEALGISYDNVKIRIYRARRKLKEELADYFPEYL